METSNGIDPGTGVTPLPEPVPDGFEKRDDGIYELSSRGSNPVRIAGPISIIAITRDRDTGIYGFVARWTDFRGRSVQQAFPMELLHEQGTSLAKCLASLGLDVMPRKEASLSRYLGGFRQQRQISEWTSTGQLGWHKGANDALQYVFPSHVAGTGKNTVVFQTDCAVPTTQSMHSAGTLGEWNEYVLRQCLGNPYLVFAIGVSLAAPLLRFAGQECGGFHYYGSTSQGKTTAAQVAASIMGCGADPAEKPELSFVQRWNTTANALEGLSAAHNDNLLVLDELGTFQNQDFGPVVYNLLGGTGKRRLNKNSKLMTATKWHLMVLSTGEISTREKIEEHGKKAKGGQQIRLADIPTAHGLVSYTHGLPPERFVQRLKSACANYYGSAGPAFINELIREYGDESRLAATITANMEHALADLVTDQSPNEHQRVSRRFALIQVAGELACRLGILECSSDEFARASAFIFRQWANSVESLPEGQRGIGAVQAFISASEARFQPACGSYSEFPVRDRVGYKFTDKSGQEFFGFTTEGFAIACGACNRSQTLTELAETGLLNAEKGRQDRKITVDSKRMRVTAVSAEILSWEPGAAGHRV